MSFFDRDKDVDEPATDPQAPRGDDAYPGGSGMLPPTGDMDDPVPETGMPGGPEPREPQLDQEEDPAE